MSGYAGWLDGLDEVLAAGAGGAAAKAPAAKAPAADVDRMQQHEGPTADVDRMQQNVGFVACIVSPL